MKSTKKSLEGKVGTVVTRNISKREGWERGTEGTRPENSKTHGTTLVYDHSRQSDHAIRELTKFEQASGHDPRIKRGSPIVGTAKRFGK